MTDKQICDRVLGDGGFWGADFSSSVTYADPHRLTECVNLWRDYASDVGDFVETFPGVRRVASLGGVKAALPEVYDPQKVRAWIAKYNKVFR